MVKQIIVASGLSLVGCAGAQIAPEKFEESQASIRGAEEVGANDVPAAKLHLQLAKDQTEKAKKMSAAGDPAAELMLARARSDAELAVVLSREDSIRQEAVKATEDLKTLQDRGNP